MPSQQFNIVKLEETERQLLLGFFDDLRQAIIKKQAEKGIRASGKSAEALRVDFDPATKTASLIDGSGYFRFEEYGRRPTGTGASAGTPTLQQAIYDWLEFRKYGLSYANDKERTSLSWAISKKIHAEGTLTYRLQQPTGVITEVINNEMLKPLVEALNREYAIAIKSDVVANLKQLQTY